VIFVGRFLPGLRFSIYFCAGTLHVRPAVFLVYDTLAALLSVPFLVYLAWIFGEHIDRVIHWARRSEWGILVVAVVAAAFLLFKLARYRKRRRRELQTTSATVANAARAFSMEPPFEFISRPCARRARAPPRPPSGRPAPATAPRRSCAAHPPARPASAR